VKNSKELTVCPHWTLHLHSCHILYALQYSYLLQAAFPQNTPTAAVQYLYSNVFMIIRPSHLSVSDSLVYSSCLVLPSVLRTTRHTTDRPQSTLQHPHRPKTRYLHCSLCLQITTIIEVYTACSVCLSRLHLWCVCTLLLLWGLWW
jgi:hypothetical protein